MRTGDTVKHNGAETVIVAEYDDEFVYLASCNSEPVLVHVSDLEKY